ncbi:class II aaRS and biotin synthetase [Lentinula aff. detonsa]|uniref:Class II aaRS and biotin synthetase n=1 Tax=Lentinula aff. detonsa TaxID=2804958 RepID=A0AA38L276_9AGAR|nr:class II aaRS and biotin synthetase [Lentinula aff. detonsa]KAJ3795456.1 class II aaRS and biotin synthetase [Lentinula aff. detonsa]
MVNLLVYSGPEVLPSALRTTLSHLARILLPNYTIQPISVSVLLSQPWTANCQVLIFPALKSGTGSAGIFAGIPPRLNGVINDFLEGGGQVLLLNAAGRITRGFGGRGLGGMGGMGSFNGALGNNASNFDSDTFAFADRTTGLTISPISLPESSQKNSKDQTTRRIRSEGGLSGVEPVEGIVEGGMPQFEFANGVGAGLPNKMEVLAETMEQDGSHIAALKCQIGSGFVTFWAPNLENLSEENSPSSTSTFSDPSSSRLILLRYVLSRIGLKPPNSTAGSVSRLLPQFLLSTPDKPGLVETVVHGLLGSVHGGVFQDTHNTFEFYEYDEGLRILRQMKTHNHFESVDDDPSHAHPSTSHITICPNGTVPSIDDTPLFDLSTYFNLLREARARDECRRDVSGFGETLFYGQVVGSTQSMFDKNPRFLSSLVPSIPILSLGSHQLAGRGRGANAWISPSGCLQFSLCIPKVPLSPHSPYINTICSSSSFSSLTPSYIPPSKLVFIQYLFALAVVEACSHPSILGPTLGANVRLKWPNDIYVCYGNPSRPERAEKIKIGGILVSTSFAPGGHEASVVIGCGLNVLCRHPLFSLMRVGKPTLSTPYRDPCCPTSMKDELGHLSMEGTLATILARFEKMWEEFLGSGGSFERWMGRYQDKWLHSDQLVRLTTVDPPMMVRICGITPDHGLLRTLPERNQPGHPGRAIQEGFIDLQPDGNSFDLMAGLIKVKGP